MATDTFTTDTQPHPNQPHLPMETHFLIPTTLCATWVLPPPLPNPETFFTLSPSYTSRSSIPRFTAILLPRHKYRTYQTTCFGTPQNINHEHTKPRARFFAPGTLNAPNHVPTFHQSCYSTKGHPDTLYGAGTPPFKYRSSHNILPFCHCNSSTSLLQYTLIIFSTIWYVIIFVFSLYFINTFPSRTIPSVYYPLLPSSSHPPTSLDCTLHQQ